MLFRISSIWKKGKGEFATNAKFAVNAQLGRANVNVGAMDVEGGFHFDGVTRTNAVLEAHFVDACIEGQFADEIVLHEEGAALGHDFAEDDTRNDGFTWEMAFQEKLLAGNVVLRVRHMVLVEGHLVDQEHRLTVREVLFDFFSVHIFSVLDFPDGDTGIVTAEAQ